MIHIFFEFTHVIIITGVYNTRKRIFGVEWTHGLLFLCTLILSSINSVSVHLHSHSHAHSTHTGTGLIHIGIGLSSILVYSYCICHIFCAVLIKIFRVNVCRSLGILAWKLSIEVSRAIWIEHTNHSVAVARNGSVISLPSQKWLLRWLSCVSLRRILIT